MEFIIIPISITEWDACILTDMPREEDMFMFLQEVLDQRGDGYTEMTDIVSIISLTYLIIDQESSLTEVILQDIITDSIMEMAEHKASLTEVIIIWGAARVLMLCTEMLVHSTDAVPWEEDFKVVSEVDTDKNNIEMVG